MRYITKLLIVILFGVLSEAYAETQRIEIPDDPFVSGQAQSRKTGQTGYMEYYLDDPVSDELRARYFSSEGRVLASKRLTFSADNSQPIFEIYDYRANSGYRVVPTEDRLKIQKLKLLENDYSAVVDLKEVMVVEPTVVDAGFHRFLMKRWDAITAGNAVRFNFLLVDKARLVSMLASRTDCHQIESLCVRVVPGNLFYRMFIPPVILTFEKDSRRLVRYSGYGPLLTESGDAFPVTLNYRYAD